MNHPGRLPLSHPSPPLRAADRPRSGRIHLLGRGGDRPGADRAHATRSCSTPRTSTSALVELRQGGAPVAADAHDRRRRRTARDHRRAAARRPATPCSSCGSTAPISHGLLGFYRSTYVDEAGRRAGARRDPVRGAARPRRVPVLRRARVQGDVRDHARGRRRAARALERTRDRPRETLRRRATCVSDSARRSRCRRISSRGSSARSRSPSRSTRAASRCASRTCPGTAHLTRFALDVGAFAITFFADYYGIAYPGEKCDLVALPDFSFGAMENLGCVTFRETRLLLDPDAGDARRDVGRRAHDRARDRAHVVRRPRDHEVVERHLAQRGVRHVHGAPRRRRVQARVEDLGRVRARPRRRARRRRAREHPHRRVRGGHARGRRRHVRPPHVPKGRLGPAHARALARRRRVPRRRAPLPRPLPAREHRDDRPLGRAGGGDRQAGAPDHGHVDLPARLPVACASTTAGDDQQPRFSYGGADARRAVGAPGAGARAHAASASETRSLLLDGDAARRSTSPTTRSSCSTRAARASTASRTRRHGATACSTRACCEPLERFSLVDDLWASVLAGDATAAELPRTARAASRRDRPRRVARARERTCAARPASSTATRSTRMRAEIADDRRRRRCSGSAGTAAPTTTRTRQLRGLVINVLGTLVRGPGDDRAGPRVVRPRRGRRRRRVGRRSASSRATATPTTFDEFARAGDATARRRRSSCATSTRSATFPTEELVAARGRARALRRGPRRRTVRS